MTQTQTLASVVTERRNELGIGKSELARRAGISRGSIHEIEAGNRQELMPDTSNALDKALEWSPGTLRRLTHDHVPPRTMMHLDASNMITTPASTVSIQAQLDEVRRLLVMISEQIANLDR